MKRSDRISKIYLYAPVDYGEVWVLTILCICRAGNVVDIERTERRKIRNYLYASMKLTMTQTQ